MRILKSYIENEDGNFAMLFGLVSTVLLIGAVGAMDVASITTEKTNLQDQLDSAALAAVIEVTHNGYNFVANGEGNTEPNQVYKELVLKSLESNGYDLGGAEPEVVAKNGFLTVSMTKSHDLFFGGVFNSAQTNITAETQVTLPGNGGAVEIALVLDNTESMNHNGKMTALKDGARNFITAIEESGSGSKIAMVPFSRYVDVGEDKRGEPWLNVPAEFDTDRTWQQATHSGGTCTMETQTRFDDGIEVTFETEVCTGQTTTYETLSTVIESRWIGCVGVRSNGLHLEDDSYNTAATRIPGLLHRWPYEVTGLSWDTESWCPDTVTPLTDDYDHLRSRVGWLYGTDRTYIPMGLSWGRRILSPQAPFTEADAANPKRQIMILMSDGQNTAYLDNSIGAQNNLVAPPYIEDLTSEEQQNGVTPPGTDLETAQLCEIIKAEGTEMFTIAFQVDNPATRALLENCASSPNHYFDAGSNAMLVASFESISGSLESEIRLAK